MTTLAQLMTVLPLGEGQAAASQFVKHLARRPRCAFCCPRADSNKPLPVSLPWNPRSTWLIHIEEGKSLKKQKHLPGSWDVRLGTAISSNPAVGAPKLPQTAVAIWVPLFENALALYRLRHKEAKATPSN